MPRAKCKNCLHRNVCSTIEYSNDAEEYVDEYGCDEFLDIKADEEIMRLLEQCVRRCNRNYDTDIVLALINRQKSEIDKMKMENKIYIKANRAIGNQRDQRDKEIDELQKQINGLDVRENKIKIEAYKEFAEKLQAFCKEIIAQKWNEKAAPISWSCAYADFIDDIDNLLKEMAGIEDVEE